MTARYFGLGIFSGLLVSIFIVLEPAQSGHTVGQPSRRTQWSSLWELWNGSYTHYEQAPATP